MRNWTRSWTRPTASTARRADLPSRRRLLGGAAAAIALAGARPASAGQSAGDADILVLGAGIAGLAAAAELSRAGARVVVLEARDRIGGRIATDRRLGPPVELGAAWIHGTAGNPLAEIARHLELPTFRTDFNSLTLADRAGRAVDDDTLDDLDDRYEALMVALARDGRRGLSVAEGIATLAPQDVADPLMQWALAANAEFDTGAPLGILSSALFDAEEAFGGPDLLLPRGYDRLLAPLAAGLDIRLGQVVREVAWNRQGVTVRTDRQVHAARKAICCLPLGVLQARSLAFTPALPGPMQVALQRLGAGAVAKAVALFERPFWPSGIQFFGRLTEPPGRWCYILNHMAFGGGPILTLFSFGAAAAPAEALDDAEAEREIVVALRQVFGPQASAPARLLRSGWTADPFARGAYSYPRPDAVAADFDLLAGPVGDRLFLAGEHTLFAHQGTAHGALLSGRRAAAAALAAPD
ncbi:flavin monoamine oxidase family protein [Marinibaculum pumilum]|uniref:Tryptophan 2-monooxygenase n=1 Tax=Marinibaculum pumilum TaxID=1766165 RepID=A0ABV7L3L6_9PROT